MTTGVAIVGGAAALAGLLFVAVPVNSEIAAFGRERHGLDPLHPRRRRRARPTARRPLPLETRARLGDEFERPYPPFPEQLRRARERDAPPADGRRLKAV